MKKVSALLVFAAALAMVGAGGEAMAAGKQDQKSSSGLTFSFKPLKVPGFQTEDTSLNDQPQSRVYQFDLPGRWGFKFDVNQPERSPPGANDIDAGAFFKVTPSVRVGGSVGLGERSRNLKPVPQNRDDDKQPRVRLETTLKF